MAKIVDRLVCTFIGHKVIPLKAFEIWEMNNALSPPPVQVCLRCGMVRRPLHTLRGFMWGEWKNA